MLWTRIALACSLAAGVAACVVEESSGVGGSTGVLPPETIPIYGDSGITGDGAPSATPMLAKIDTNKTMNIAAGQGVGVFTEYDAGGHWNIMWTCDTLVSADAGGTGAPCAFDIKISVNRGSITNGTADGFAQADQLTTSNVGLEATTSTTTMIQGIRFDTDPGAVITLSAALGGAYSGSFLFFVQDSLINGGYTGSLTDPLELEGSSP